MLVSRRIHGVVGGIEANDELARLQVTVLLPHTRSPRSCSAGADAEQCHKSMQLVLLDRATNYSIGTTSRQNLETDGILPPLRLHA
jgi:hypothetical protein